MVCNQLGGICLFECDFWDCCPITLVGSPIQPYSMELITVLQGRLSADYKTEVGVSDFEIWISDLSFRMDFRFEFYVFGIQI